MPTETQFLKISSSMSLLSSPSTQSVYLSVISLGVAASLGPVTLGKQQASIQSAENFSSPP